MTYKITDAESKLRKFAMQKGVSIDFVSCYEYGASVRLRYTEADEEYGIVVSFLDHPLSAAIYEGLDMLMQHSERATETSFEMMDGIYRRAAESLKTPWKYPVDTSAG